MRGISITIDELFHSAEYIFSGGNEKILLCERGIRNYEKASRNTFDINIIPMLKEKTHLSIIADPSNEIGIREHVDAVAMTATVAGVDGVIFETHCNPQKAFSDGPQTLAFAKAPPLVSKLKTII